MIRKFQISDTEQVMKIWLSGNMEAHSFVPEKYWQSHFKEVQEALQQADVWVYDINGNVHGFIGLINEYIAGIFVDKNYRSKGIGTQLVNFVKEKYYRNLLGGLYRENPVKSRNYEAVKSSKKWENVGNSYIIPALLLYRYSYI